MPRWPKKDTPKEQHVELVELAVPEPEPVAPAPVEAQNDEEVEVTPEVQLPKAIVLLTPDAYLDEDGVSHLWPDNKIIRKPESIRVLVERKANYRIVEE